MTRRQAGRVAIGVALAGLFLVLTFRNLAWRDIAAPLAAARPAYLLAAVAAFLAGYACRVERWRLMLVHENRSLAWTQCAGPFFASVALNNVLPLRAGDLLRAWGFASRLGVTAATALTTLAVERILDVIVIVVLLGVAATLFGTDTSALIGAGGGVLAAGGACLLAVLAWPGALSRTLRAAARVVSRVAPGAGARVERQMARVVAAVDHIGHRSTMLRLVAWSLLAWIGEGCVFWCVALALPALPAPDAAWLALPVGTLATVIPSTPGYVGTFDFFTARAMAAAGNPQAAATAYALLVHAVLWLPPTLAGAPYLLWAPPAGRAEHRS